MGQQNAPAVAMSLSSVTYAANNPKKNPIAMYKAMNVVIVILLSVRMIYMDMLRLTHSNRGHLALLHGSMQFLRFSYTHRCICIGYSSIEFGFVIFRFHSNILPVLPNRYLVCSNSIDILSYFGDSFIFHDLFFMRYAHSVDLQPQYFTVVLSCITQPFGEFSGSVQISWVVLSVFCSCSTFNSASFARASI
jgi:hypothetical protein